MVPATVITLLVSDGTVPDENCALLPLIHASLDAPKFTCQKLSTPHVPLAVPFVSGPSALPFVSQIRVAPCAPADAATIAATAAARSLFHLPPNPMSLPTVPP